MQTEDITKLGVLCSLEKRTWSAIKRIPKEKLKNLASKKLSSWVKANKGLIDKNALTEINSKITKAINIIQGASLPFPIRGIWFVPKELVLGVSQQLDEVIEELNILVNKFADKYDDYIEAAREELGLDLFNEADYPQDIKSKFGIAYKFLELGVPGEIKKISPKLYNEEMVKFTNMMEQARNEGILFLREAFADCISSIVDSLKGKTTGETKRIRSESVEKVEKFFEEFKSKNIFKDNELLKLIENGRDAIFGVSSKDLTNSDALRKHVTKEMEKVKEELEKSISSYKRKIVLS